MSDCERQNKLFWNDHVLCFFLLLYYRGGKTDVKGSSDVPVGEPLTFLKKDVFG